MCGESSSRGTLRTHARCASARSNPNLRGGLDEIRNLWETQDKDFLERLELIQNVQQRLERTRFENSA